MVRATNAGGASANSNQASATTLVAAPAAPSGLTATAASSSQINLAWTDNSGNETNFVVARSTTTGGPYTDIATLGANVTSFSNTGLAANTTYHYVVRTTNAGGASANSNQASATTLPNAPAAPGSLAATAASSSQINLTWTDNASNETNHVVARATTSGGPYTDIATLGANVTSFSNTGLAANTTYHYVVRATNAGGASANSNQASALTWPAEVIVDNTATGFTASANWLTSTNTTDKYGTDFRHRNTAAVSDTATWSFTVPQTRQYEVYAWWSQGTNRSTTAPYIVAHAGGTTTVNRNQQANGGSWQSLGTFTLNAGTNNVRLSCWTTTGFVVVADAVRIVPR